MKRIFTSFLALSILVSSASAAFVDPTPAPSSPAGSPVASAPMLPAHLTVASIEAMTGKKLNFIQKAAVKIAAKKARKTGDNQIVAAILCFFLGTLGVHRFYLGYTWQGVVQLLTAGGFVIWAIIDLVRICTGDLQPKDSEYKTTF